MVVDQKPATKRKAFNDSDYKKMAEDTSLDKRHWRHKPYKCDFGGGKRGKML